MAIGLFYSLLSEGRTDDEQVELDALLGDDEAVVERDRRRMNAVITDGGEVA